MKITFLTAGYENLAVQYLSSYIQNKGYKTSLVFDPLLFSDWYYDIPYLAKIFNFTPRVIKKIFSEKPDIICISAITPFYRWAIKVADEIKNQMDVPIVIGGIHASAVPERVIKNKSIDMVCVGEGEEPLLDIVNALENRNQEQLKKISNIWYKEKEGRIFKNKPRPLSENIDTYPFPDKEMFYSKSKSFRKRYMVITSRGCIFNCTYCSNNVWRGVYHNICPWKIRRRSVDNVIEELKIGVERWHPIIVNFVDDAFNMNKKWIEEFAIKYEQEIGIPFTSFAHPKFVDKKLVQLLKKAGLLWFELGIQSLNEDIKKNILHRYETNDEAINAMKTLKKENVAIYVDHMIGLPYQTEKDLQNAARVYNKIKPEVLFCFDLIYFPKSKIIDTALEIGLIDQKNVEDIEEGYQIDFLLGGDVKNNHMFNKYRVLFKLLPNVSYKKGEKLIEKVMKTDFLWSKSSDISVTLLNLLRNHDKMYRIFIRHYMEYLWKFIIRKAQ